jgi:hypothetical protein
MVPLKIKDIREWLIENRNEYQELKAQEFPPFNNEVYWMYEHLKNFIEYYKFKNKCDNALLELNTIYNSDFSELSKWTKEYEVLDSQDLIMFEINYINLREQVSNDRIRIYEGLYTERKPFANILCFCKLFQLLYWDNSIHETLWTEKEQLSIKKKVGRILKKYYIDKDHE